MFQVDPSKISSFPVIEQLFSETSVSRADLPGLPRYALRPQGADHARLVTIKRPSRPSWSAAAPKAGASRKDAPSCRGSKAHFPLLKSMSSEPESFRPGWVLSSVPSTSPGGARAWCKTWRGGQRRPRIFYREVDRFSLAWSYQAWKL